MAKFETQLLLKIEQGGNVVHRSLSTKDSLSVGQHLQNDVIIHDGQFPKKHVLFAGSGKHFRLNLLGYMNGEVIAGDDAKLNFHDMIAHDLLQRKGNAFIYTITAGKRGRLLLGDARITFQCRRVEVKAAEHVSQPKFIGYSWTYATLRQMRNDLPFKAILLLLVAVHVFLLNYMSGLPTEFTTSANANQVPERLARIIVRNPEPAAAPAARGVAVGSEEETSSGEKERAEKSGEERGGSTKPENMGLLGLLTGTGSSKSNELADFLLDKGLARELDEVMSATDLALGQGNGSSSGDSDNLDDLFSASQAGGGIDDLLGEIGDIESVALGEKGQIEVDRIGGMSGSQSALGKRSEESVRSVMLSYTGRLTYIYNKYLKREANLSGKMVVEVEIAADGTVANVELVSSTIGNAEFEREVLNLVRRWKYPAIDSGTVTVTYPLFFNKMG